MDEVVPWLVASWRFWAAAALMIGGLTYAALRCRTAAPRAWWKRKRWAAALALWVLVAYPLSLGPAAYCQGRGWCPDALIETVYAPLILAARPSPGVTRKLQDYVVRWHQLGHAHLIAGRPALPTPPKAEP